MAKTHPQSIEIDGRRIGIECPPYIIAEMSGNHKGDINRAFQLLEAAKDAGADAVKLQTYRPDTITINHDAPEFMVEGGLWGGRRLYELYEEAHTPWEWHEPLFERAQELSITIFSSPFDPTAVDLLEQLGAPAYKIASPEIIDLPLIRLVAQTGKPLIISTGMATSEEIEEAIATARDAGGNQMVVLHCTSAYPTPPEHANLNTIKDIAKRFGVLAGLSDHTLGSTVATTSIALGACVVEKHFTLSRAEGGVDSDFSLEPAELAALVQDTQTAYAALGKPAYGPTDIEAGVLKHRRSLYIVADVKAGELLTTKNVRSIRPANGLKPKHLDRILGTHAARDLRFGEPLDETMIEGRLA